MVYCSSDAWAGDAGPASNPMGWQFRGQRIVAAVLQTLRQQQGLGSLPGTRLLFAGCSAGSRGAMFNLDRVPARRAPGPAPFIANDDGNDGACQLYCSNDFFVTS